jgi:hypothetical protein
VAFVANERIRRDTAKQYRGLADVSFLAASIRMNLNGIPQRIGNDKKILVVKPARERPRASLFGVLVLRKGVRPDDRAIDQNVLRFRGVGNRVAQIRPHAPPAPARKAFEYRIPVTKWPQQHSPPCPATQNPQYSVARTTTHLQRTYTHVSMPRQTARDFPRPTT